MEAEVAGRPLVFGKGDSLQDAARACIEHARRLCDEVEDQIEALGFLPAPLSEDQLRVAIADRLVNR